MYYRLEFDALGKFNKIEERAALPDKVDADRVFFKPSYDGGKTPESLCVYLNNESKDSANILRIMTSIVKLSESKNFDDLIISSKTTGINVNHVEGVIKFKSELEAINEVTINFALKDGMLMLELREKSSDYPFHKTDDPDSDPLEDQNKKNYDKAVNSFKSVLGDNSVHTTKTHQGMGMFDNNVAYINFNDAVDHKKALIKEMRHGYTPK